MRNLFIIPLLLLSLTPLSSWGESMDDLVLRDGLFYKRSSDTPFTGELDDQRTRGSIENGKQEGSWIVYWKNGELSSKGHYKNGKHEESWVYHYDDGRLWSEEYWENAKQEGSWVTYWGNGQLRSKGNYKNGKQDGPWVSYWKDGEISEWETGAFKDGVRIGN